DSRFIRSKMPQPSQKWICIQTKDLKDSLDQKINCSSVLLQLLANRNINTEEEINSFLNPSIKVLKSPALLPNIDIAVRRLKKAIKAKESVLIFGDYDTDGIVSSALMFNFLKKAGLDPDIYIPDRFDEGYDISMDFIRNKVLESDLKSKYSLIICVDCGTNSNQVKDYILSGKSSDIDIIVCDHHEPGGHEDFKPGSASALENQYIIINPKLAYSKYPFKNLSGAGVTFKFIFAAFKGLDASMKSRFEKKFGKTYIRSLLDLVAISTIADLMPLVDENRAIVCIGLKMLHETRNYGLKKLVEKFLNDKKDITTHDIGFIIAPRLNAAGRIKNAMDSVEILKEEFEEKSEDTRKNEISKIIDDLDLFNIERQLIQKEILKEILESKKYDFERIVNDQKIFISKSSEWNEGVLGVVAANLVKKLNVPVILFKENKDKLKGSGRSIEKFDLLDSISLLKDYFIKFGGHRQACGITMDIKKYEVFEQELIKIAQNNLDDIDIRKHYYYDLEIDFSQVNEELISELKRMEPFGIDNPKPVFLTKGCSIQESRQLQNGKHVSLLLKNSNLIVKAILFNAEDKKQVIINTGNHIDILFNIEENNWNGKKEARIVIVSFDSSPSTLISI
ncbi:MAG: single-stranded-DNA-specific exonuclease RecJ, partial [Actinobacteria bacterium]|nr:single-stranded-DNA-specific exonuclease RecJ [Actinomycetota bacterium]